MGLHIYNLDGEEQQRLSIGRLNNVDLRASADVRRIPVGRLPPAIAAPNL